jgi:hypothetical protein
MVKAVAKPNAEIHFCLSAWLHLAFQAAAKGWVSSYRHSIIGRNRWTKRGQTIKENQCLSQFAHKAQWRKQEGRPHTVCIECEATLISRPFKN